LWLEDFHPGTADRFYKTGDLVQYQVDGSIKFVGRIVAQRKFNGQRIEMGEIEYQIMTQLPNLRETMVEILRPRHGVQQETLVAFVCFSDASSRHQTYSNGQALRLSANEKTTLLHLQEMLRAKMPAYMVPSLFVPLREIPITTSGKVGRESLAQYVSELLEDQLFHYYLSDAAE
jgi:acyl-coenzyme A synthetase/AMP-(fatty) acid ligase